jgi:hypothetical protein
MIPDLTKARGAGVDGLSIGGDAGTNAVIISMRALSCRYAHFLYTATPGIVLPLLRPRADDRRHHPRERAAARLQEQPLEVRGGGALRDSRLAPLDHVAVAALLRAVACPRKRAAAVGDQADTVIALGMRAFHDTFLARFSMARNATFSCPEKHCGLQ